MTKLVSGLWLFACSGLIFSTGYMVQWFVGRRTHPDLVSGNLYKAAATLLGAIAVFSSSWGMTAENLQSRISIGLWVMTVAIALITLAYLLQLLRRLDLEEPTEKTYLSFACFGCFIAALSAILMADGVMQL